ncbi:MAG TPA: pyridoxal phosphate-dependent aminotransferase [Polyangiaceae bacterium]
MKLSRAALDVRPGVFAELQKHIDAVAARGGDLIPLQIGDTCRTPPPFPAQNPADLHPYGATAGLAELRMALAKHMTTHGIGPREIDPASEICLGVGGTHAIFCGARAILDPGDEVLLAAPYWPLAHGILSTCGAKVVEVPFTSRLYADEPLDPYALFERYLTPSTKAIYVIDPNNPDGKVLTAKQVERVADFVREHDLWAISDEVYAHLVFERPHTTLARFEGMKERTITAFSFSKSHALAGARVGAIVASADVIAAARRVAVHSSFNVPVAMQRAALGALAAPDSWLAEARADYMHARDAVLAALKDLPVNVDRAEGGTYVMIDFSPVLGERKLAELLTIAIEKGVLLAPGEAFGAVSAKSARLCYTAVPLPRVLEGVKRLGAAIDAFKSR